MIKFWLWCYDNLAEILALVAIILAIISGDDLLQQPKETKAKNKFVLWILQKPQRAIAAVLVFGSVFITFKAFSVHNRKTVVPDLCGMTYEDAVKSINENRLKGQLILAETNEDLARPSSRVIWQSLDPDSPVKTETTISFLVDDGFSLTATPLNQYRYRDVSVDQTKKLDYRCDYKETLQQAKSAMENGEPIDYVIEDPHWNIRIGSAELQYYIEISYWQDMPHTSADVFYSYNRYAGAMSATLEELVEASIVIVGGDHKLDLQSCTVIGKLIPTEKENGQVMRCINVPNYNGVFLLPQSLVCGEYRFAFSVIDSDDRMYEWYHFIYIEDADERS